MIVAAITLLGALLRAPLRSAGLGLIVPFVMAVPLLVLFWHQQSQRRRSSFCPNCELPLSYRPLGPRSGMWECPALCGFRKLVGDPGDPP